jgi:hypothetical protein
MALLRLKCTTLLEEHQAFRLVVTTRELSLSIGKAVGIGNNKTVGMCIRATTLVVATSIITHLLVDF